MSRLITIVILVLLTPLVSKGQSTFEQLLDKFPEYELPLDPQLLAYSNETLPVETFNNLFFNYVTEYPYILRENGEKAHAALAGKIENEMIEYSPGKYDTIKVFPLGRVSLHPDYYSPTGASVHQVEKGIRILLDHMEDGHPVQVGVDYKSEASDPTNNHDKSTDHFIVLSSLHFDETRDEFYFMFYENGTAYGPDSDDNLGTSDDNKIYIEKDANGNYKLKSTVGPPADRDASDTEHRFYKITQIRINNDMPTGDTPDTVNQLPTNEGGDFSSDCIDTRRCY